MLESLQRFLLTDGVVAFCAAQFVAVPGHWPLMLQQHSTTATVTCGHHNLKWQQVHCLALGHNTQHLRLKKPVGDF